MFDLLFGNYEATSVLPFKCEESDCEREPDVLIVCEKTGLFLACNEHAKSVIATEVEDKHAFRIFEIREFKMATRTLTEPKMLGRAPDLVVMDEAP